MAEVKDPVVIDLSEDPDSDVPSDFEDLESKSSFRVSSKHLLLTYSQCGDHTAEDLSSYVMDICKSKGWSLKSWCAATEKHSDGERHVHIGLKFSKRPNIKDPRVFDYECDPSYCCSKHVVPKLRVIDAWDYLMICDF